MRPAALRPLAETTALPPLQQVRVPHRCVLVADQAVDARAGRRGGRAWASTTSGRYASDERPLPLEGELFI